MASDVCVAVFQGCVVFTAEEAADDPCAGRPMCMLACEHGFVHDDEGCDTCECAAGASRCLHVLTGTCMYMIVIPP